MVKAESDSFWAMKTPVKVKLGQGQSSPSLTKHVWQRKKMMNLMTKLCTHCHKKIPVAAVRNLS